MDITTEHPEYRAGTSIWQRYSDLYAGGEQLKRRAEHYLAPRAKEPPDIYAERLSKVFYENYIGSIIDWYGATLFRREPTIVLEQTDDKTRAYYAEFVENCDLHGTTLAQTLRRTFITALIYGRSYLLIDFPASGEQPRTRADEDSRGLSNAYLVSYDPRDLINWSRDVDGSLEWVVLRQRSGARSTNIDETPKQETRYLYYDRTSYRIYSQPEGQTEPVLVSAGTHGLAREECVPILELGISDGLWLMNKSALLQVEHLNKSNALAWAISMGLFSMPVIYSDREWKQILGESYYIQLNPHDRFGWTEPEGKVYQIASDNLARLKEEIYRVCFLVQQARPVSGSGSLQSGLSKQQDLYVTHEVLRSYGDLVKDFAKILLRQIQKARGDRILIDVQGMDDFDISDFAADLADAETLLRMNVPSTTLRKTIYKKIASKYLCDIRQDIKDQINHEIDKAILQ
ncbi:MAG: hypothetical protein JST93_31145 [Acidobacteria bacterium]|nr:hypothetical protein [Acidobacteriota bacterium]